MHTNGGIGHDSETRKEGHNCIEHCNSGTKNIHNAGHTTGSADVYILKSSPCA